jgi:hypothetical protein
MNKENEHRKYRRRRGDMPDWTRIHHSPWFWVGALLFLAAIAIYVATEDLSWRPRLEHH